MTTKASRAQSPLRRASSFPTFGAQRLPGSPTATPRRRWLEPKASRARVDAALKAALDRDDMTAAWHVLRRPHWRAALSWFALNDAAGLFDMFGSRPWPGLVAAVATAEALRRRRAWRFPKAQSGPAARRFLWSLEEAGVIYERLARARSATQLARWIGEVADREGQEDVAAIGLELLGAWAKSHGGLSAATRRALAPALMSRRAQTRQLAIEVIARLGP